MKNYWKILALAATPTLALAAPVQFTIDSSQSQVAASGSVAGAAMQEQGPGSLTSTFGGALMLDLGSGTVQFNSSSLLHANTNGNWEPLPGGQPGKAPADYGAQATIAFATAKGAARNIQLNVSSPVIPMNNGQFSAAQLVFAFPTNSTAAFDFNAGFLGSGSRAFAGASTNKTATVGSVTNSSGNQVLTIDINTTFTFKILAANDSSLTLVGRIVATRSAGPSFTAISVTNGTVRLTVANADASFHLEKSKDLVHWTSAGADVTIQGNNRILTTPAEGQLEFFRLVK